MFCPVPILMTARKVKAMAPGDLLEVIGDDPGIIEDMPVWCEETGHRLVSLELKGALTVSVIRV